jgi:hypothetical protein
MSKQSHVSSKYDQELFHMLPYAVYIAVCFHLINIFYQSFIKYKLLIILEQSWILCTESVTRDVLIKRPKILVFLPPRNNNRKCVHTYGDFG